jgi:bifunctional DNA-binding transcriptional regulator/antitoxin component of YhaV-PrlF toxin-antitoxin module
MPIQAKAKTKTSTIGQVILPKAMRDKHGWT